MHDSKASSCTAEHCRFRVPLHALHAQTRCTSGQDSSQLNMGSLQLDMQLC